MCTCRIFSGCWLVHLHPPFLGISFREVLWSKCHQQYIIFLATLPWQQQPACKSRSLPSSAVVMVVQNRSANSWLLSLPKCWSKIAVIIWIIITVALLLLRQFCPIQSCVAVTDRIFRWIQSQKKTMSPIGLVGQLGLFKRVLEMLQDGCNPKHTGTSANPW